MNLARVETAIALGLLLSVAWLPARGGTELITGDTPWRAYLVTAPPMMGTRDKCTVDRRHQESRPSRLPPAEWHSADFDDSVWGRYTTGLYELTGGYGFRQSPWSALLCLRTRFGIDDPAKVKDLQLRITHRGGVVAHVNGKEVGRGHMPEGEIEPLTLANDYPEDAFTAPDGRRLPRDNRPSKNFRDRYERRIRGLVVRIPAALLRKGGNDLAIEIHRTAMRHSDWSSVGICGIELTSHSGAGVMPWAKATGSTYLWNAAPMATIADKPGDKLPYRGTWNVGALAVSPIGIRHGNPFDPLRPIRMVGPRRGVCSGQVVVSSPKPPVKLEAEISGLMYTTGTFIPQENVRIRYAVQQEGARYCDALMPGPATNATTLPVWIVADIPEDQARGLYTGTLKVSVDDREFSVPVELRVSAWTLPEPKKNLSFASLLQSPDTLAMKYNVEPWSKKHFCVLEKSVALMGQVGNDQLFIPVVLNTHLGHRTGMVQWTKGWFGYKPNFDVLERFMDLYEKHCGPPKVICLIVWKPQYGNKARFRGAQVKDKEPVMVTFLDKDTGKMTPMQAPMFGEAGSEKFWKALINGVRKRVRKRGWDERALMIGQGFDSRPLKPVVEFFEEIAPGMRWTVLSHWVGDPRPKDGKLIALPGIEVGFREECAGGVLPELHKDYPNVPKREYLCAGGHRIELLTWSSPTSYRNLVYQTGTFCRIGLDFWPIVKDPRRDRLRSIFNSGICGYWLYKSNPVEIIAPGPDGPVPTVRFQMLREGLQETEAHILIRKSVHELSEEKQKECRRVLGEWGAARGIANTLTQAQISMDWLGLTERLFAAAAEVESEIRAKD